MTRATFADLVARALTAIQDDSPSYREPLRELASHAELPALLAQPGGSELMLELRQLRPVGLWVRDEAERALEAKRDLALDGALALIGRDDVALLPAGRECWLVLPTGWDAPFVRALPRGFGLVLAEPSAGALETLRRAAPLRALGVCCASLTQVAGERLDLVLLEAVVPGGAAQPESGGARVLCAGLTPEQQDCALPGSGISGLVCNGDEALRWALRLAAERPRAAL